MHHTRADLQHLLRHRYAIERELGRGGAAIVYLAQDLRLGRQVAIKMLRPSDEREVGTSRFEREIRLLASLQHPNVLALYDAGECDGIMYYVSPYVEGESLRQRMLREGPLPVADAVRIASDVAEALDYAHRRGVIHRDVKPENILLAGNRAILADFGIARISTQDEELTLTAAGIPGTPLYMSPEQPMSDEAIDGRSDIYSLGLVLYEMLVGELPHRHERGLGGHAWKYVMEPPRVGSLRRGVPASVEETVATALRREVHRRFATGSAFARAITGEVAVASTGMAQYIRQAVTCFISSVGGVRVAPSPR